MGKLVYYPCTYYVPARSLNGLHAVGRNAVYAALGLRLRYTTVVFFVAIYPFGRVVAWIQRFPLYSHVTCLEGVLRSAKGGPIVVTAFIFHQKNADTVGGSYNNIVEA